MRRNKRAGNGCIMIIIILLVIGAIGVGFDSCTKKTPAGGPAQPPAAAKPARTPSVLTLPNLAGTPFEALTTANAWLLAFKQDVSQTLNAACSQVQAGEAPDKVFAAMKGQLERDKGLISAADGLSALLAQQEQKMTAQIAEVDKMTTEPGLDGSLKQQYGDTLSAARKSLEDYRACRANVDILARSVDETLRASEQWKQFYSSTVGITGEETARARLVELIRKEQTKWSK